jgi:hypothetical protein
MLRREFLKKGGVASLWLSLPQCISSVFITTVPTVLTKYIQSDNQPFDSAKFKNFFENKLESQQFMSLREFYVNAGHIISFERQVVGSEFHTKYRFSSVEKMNQFFQESAKLKKPLLSSEKELFQNEYRFESVRLA